MFIIPWFKALLFYATKHDPKRQKYNGPYSMERGSHARGVYPIQDTSRMGTERVKQEEETDTRIMKESSKKSGRKECGYEGGKVPKQGLRS